jgi:hypothetical protein
MSTPVIPPWEAVSLDQWLAGMRQGVKDALAADIPISRRAVQDSLDRLEILIQGERQMAETPRL